MDEDQDTVMVSHSDAGDLGLGIQNNDLADSMLGHNDLDEFVQDFALFIHRRRSRRSEH